MSAAARKPQVPSTVSGSAAPDAARLAGLIPAYAPDDGSLELRIPGVHGIARAVSWLRANFSQPMKVEELADLAHMSASSFHQHFKAVTSMSPLQYQKTLRLQEARRLMLATMMDAGAASRHVGYLSASQFSREYGRLCGNPPTRDIPRLREQAGAVAEA